VPTGVAAICVDAAGENSIIIVAGANGTVSEAAATAAAARTAPNGLVLCQLEVPLAATAAALRGAARGGARAWLTPAPVPAGGVPLDVLRDVDVLLPNEAEALALARAAWAALPPAERGAAAPPATTDEAGALLATVVREAVVVTCGSRGARVFAAAAHGSSAAAVAAIPPVPVAAAIDTTGAGDAFAGALAAFVRLLTDEGGAGGSAPDAARRFACFVEAARRAAYVAAASVTRKGAQASYFARDELPAALFEGFEGSAVGAASDAVARALRERPL
jgi:ribokinase